MFLSIGQQDVNLPDEAKTRINAKRLSQQRQEYGAAEWLFYNAGNLHVWRFHSETPDNIAHSCSFTFIWFGTSILS